MAVPIPPKTCFQRRALGIPPGGCDLHRPGQPHRKELSSFRDASNIRGSPLRLCLARAAAPPPPEQSRLQNYSYNDASLPITTLQRNLFNSPRFLAELANHLYWSRRWVVRELLLGRTVQTHCGDFSVDSKHFRSILREKIGAASTVKFVPPSSFWKDAVYKINHRLRGISYELAPAAAMLVSREWDEARMFRQWLYHLLEEHYRSSNCFDMCDALLSLVQPRERQLLGNFFPDYSMAEDHVRIVMVVHCTQNTLASKAYPGAEFFAGLGVSCQPEMARLRWRDDLINYSGI